MATLLETFASYLHYTDAQVQTVAHLLQHNSSAPLKQAHSSLEEDHHRDYLSGGPFPAGPHTSKPGPHTLLKVPAYIYI